MESVQSTSVKALQMMLAGQPTSPAKVAFAWRIAAGAALGRATDPVWTEDGTLRVRATSPDWLREAARAKPIIADRLRLLLGPDVVKTIVIDSGGRSTPRQG
jgi:hypothetical protein